MLKWTVSKKDKSEPFQLTWQHIIRLLIFFLVLYFLIYFVSGSVGSYQHPADPTVLGEESGSNLPSPDFPSIATKVGEIIPPSAKDSFSKISSSPAIISVSNTVSDFLKIQEGFPQKQIKEIKISILKSIYESVLKDIEAQ